MAQPAPVMQAYISVRGECERIIAEAGFNATFLRPWYVLGPGHRWPMLLIPMYRLFEKIPSQRETALRLGLVSVEEMAAAIAWGVENPADGVRIIPVPQIREVALVRPLVRGGSAATPAAVVRKGPAAFKLN